MDYEKKMTQEEKAKAYDEAMNKIKPLYKQAKRDDNPIWSTYEYLLPELRESEDERIRKAALEGIEYLERKLGWDAIGDTDILDVKEYLEKQKEHKPAERIEDSVKFEEGFKAGRESGLRDGQKYVLNNLDSYGLCKPAEWSEKDENTIQDCIRYLSGQVVPLDMFSKERTERNLAERLKSLRPSWKPSEEHLSALLAIFNDPDNIGSQTCQLALTDLYEQLKKL